MTNSLLEKSSKQDTSPPAAILQDTLDFTIIEHSGVSNRIFDSSYKKCSLSSVEIDTLNFLLSEIVTNYNHMLRTRTNTKLGTKIEQIDLTNYKKQFFPAMNNKGEKIVFIYCISKNDIPYVENLKLDWRKEILLSRGISCFLSTYVVLGTKNHFKFRSKGIA
ncbi:MAG: hypothetical protein EOP48_06155 [Sphingobacteriales bacterium]|nr:MAG: hypothetical protein EOP48_06155 [Sphingobacteriales bacterium]